MNDNTALIEVTLYEQLTFQPFHTFQMRTIYTNSVTMEISDYVIHSRNLKQTHPFLIDSASQFEIYYSNNLVKKGTTLLDLIGIVENNNGNVPRFKVKVTPFVHTLYYPLGLILLREVKEENNGKVVWIEPNGSGYLYCVVKNNKPMVKKAKDITELSMFTFSNTGIDRLNYMNMLTKSKI
jgi:hypothetical protein